MRYDYTAPVPVYIKKNTPVVNGALHATLEDISASSVAMDREFMLSYFNVRRFENTYSDNFSLETRVRWDSAIAMACPAVEVVVQTEVHIFFVRLMAKGCERHIAVKMGEVFQDGVSNDLSALGADVSTWQDVRIDVVHKKATIYLADEPVHSVTFKNDFGKVVGLVYNFAGTGAVDHVRLKSGAGEMVLDEDF